MAALLGVALLACAVDARKGKVSPAEIWPTEPQDAPGTALLPFADRASGKSYGLPEKGKSSVADLIALFPSAPLGVDDPDIFVAKGVEVPTDQCRGGQVVTREGLPMTLEAVVTLFPRQYMKLPICGQDERHYGVYTIEDDTGGLIVLRDSRVADFGHGDHVRLTVSGIMLTYGRDVDTRAVLIADVEPTGESEPVLFSMAEDGFTTEDVGRVERVEGFVWQVPSNDNFSELVLSREPTASDVKLEELTGDALQCALLCEPRCNSRCNKPALCGAACAERCLDAKPFEKLSAEEIPACWVVGMAAELGKRGLTYPAGAHLRVTGPVVNSYQREIWVLDPGQVETLAE
jgi:hypothetical protein